MLFSQAESVYESENLNIWDFNHLMKEIITNPHVARICSILKSTREREKRKKIKKANLPYFIPAGVFAKRNKEAMLDPSGLACIDIDDYEKDNQETRNKLMKDKYVFFIFESPSGGLKVFVKIPKLYSNPEYKKYYYALLEHFNLPEVDEGTSDICRCCYVSHDSNPYLYLDSKIFTKKAEKKKHSVTKPTKSVTKRSGDRSAADFGFICTLLRDNKLKMDIYRIMAVHGSDKWHSRDDYREITYGNAVKEVKSNE